MAEALVKLEQKLDNNELSAVVRDNVVPGRGQTVANERLVTLAERSDDSRRVKALRTLDEQFANHPRLATEGTVFRIIQISTDPRAADAVREAAAEVLKTIENPQEAQARRNILRHDPNAAYGFGLG